MIGAYSCLCYGNKGLLNFYIKHLRIPSRRLFFDNYNEQTRFPDFKYICDLNCCSPVTWAYHHKADTLHQKLVPNVSPYDLRLITF